ncbi:MAG: hypothetical protein OXC63_07180 [Aestuariivita sp.]|nr:hypothetical protein [Aestuariivita sp.]MCY4346399.1 hypothetical protein [Aestuariivita sp.]
MSEPSQRMYILLLTDSNRDDGGLRDAEIANILVAAPRRLSASLSNVFAGVMAVLSRKEQKQTRRLDGEGEATLTMLAGSEPPAGQARLTLILLAGRLVTFEIVETISSSTVCTAL